MKHFSGEIKIMYKSLPRISHGHFFELFSFVSRLTLVVSVPVEASIGKSHLTPEIAIKHHIFLKN